MNAPDDPWLARRRQALAQYRRRASLYDLELAPFQPARLAAVERLALHEGQVVLDAGCGTGLSLALLHSGVGEDGSIVGIEQSPEMIGRARKRVLQQGWRNVTLIESPVGSAKIPPHADAALLHFTHDILRDQNALRNLAHSLRPGASVVACGLQWAPPWAWPVNLFVFGAAMHSVSSLQGLGRPWSLLAPYLDDLRVDSMLGGCIYIVSGRRAANANLPMLE